MKRTSNPVILLLAFVAATTPFAAALPNTGRRITGTIENVNSQAKEVILRTEKSGSPISFIWIKRTTFSINATPADASILKKGRQVNAIYHSPFFGRPYVTRVTLQTAAAPKNQTK